MNRKERQQKLLDLLQERGELDVETLVAELNASEATVRRDLGQLHEEGLLTRTFGGAQVREANSLVVQTFEQKRQRMRTAKERIARRAAQLVEPRMAVIIDSGSTAWRLAAALKGKGVLDIFTCALAVVEELATEEKMKIHCMGGTFRLENLDFIGARAIRGFEGIQADLLFMSADSFDLERGAYSLDEVSASITKAMIACARRRVLLIDHSKFQKRGTFLNMALADIDILVTDNGLDPKLAEELSSCSFDLILA